MPLKFKNNLRLKLNEIGFYVIAFEMYENAFISHLVALIWWAENGDHRSMDFNFIAFILNFLRMIYKFESIILKKSLRKSCYNLQEFPVKSKKYLFEVNYHKF